MPRRRDQINITMFPFLSVLASMIGVLILFIVLTLSTRVIEADELYERQKEERRQQGKKENVLQGVDEGAFRELSAEVERLNKEVVARREERDRLMKKMLEIEDLIEFKKTEAALKPRPKKGAELDRPIEVEVVPERNFAVNLHPVMVEVSAEGYVVHRGHKAERFPVIRRDERDDDGFPTLHPDAGLREFLKAAEKQHRREYLLLLIHPSGSDAFFNLQAYLARYHNPIQVGWEPFSRMWLLAEPNEEER